MTPREELKQSVRLATGNIIAKAVIEPGRLAVSTLRLFDMIATAITAAVEAQRERDARIVAAAIEMAEACKRAVPSESAADAEVTRYENARHRLQTVCAAAIREG